MRKWWNKFKVSWRVMRDIHEGSRLRTVIAFLGVLVMTGKLPRIVKIVDLVDNNISPYYLGELGWVVGVILPHDHGATDEDPLLDVHFAQGRCEGFWTEELGEPFDSVKPDAQAYVDELDGRGENWTD